MKNSKSVIALLILLLPLLSATQVMAQQQYEVEVIMGDLICDAPAQIQEVSFDGTISIGPSISDASTQSQTFELVPHGSNYLIFRRTFDYLPDFLFLSDIVALPPQGSDCGTGLEDQGLGQPHSIDISSAHGFLGTQRVFQVFGENGETLNLLVTFSEIGLESGSIGYNQTICEAQSPAEIQSLTPASGGVGFEYAWQYSETGEAPWMSVHTDPDDLSSPVVSTASYTPPGLTASRWFRRSVTLGGYTVHTDPVKITVANVEEPQYSMEFYLGEYRCNSSVHDVDLMVNLNMDGVVFNGTGTTLTLEQPLFTYNFSERPSVLELNTSNPFEEPELGICPGELSIIEQLSDPTGDLVEYTVSGENETLKYFIRITEFNANTLPPGQISADQNICSGTVPEELTETIAPGGTAPYSYLWEFSINNGSSWEPTGETTRDFQPEELSMTTWFRRRVTSGCSSGVSNIVKITMADPLVAISGLAGEYAADAPLVTVVGSPSGGTFSGPGMSGNVFNPAIAGPGTHEISYTYTNGLGCSGTVSVEVTIAPEALCSSRVPLSGSGQFVLDSFTGKIVFQKTEDCVEDIALNCISAEPDAPTISNVVSASALTLSDEWDYSSHYTPKYETGLAQANAFETGTLGKWRTKANYTYSTSDINRDLNYNTGTFDLNAFSWEYEDVNKSDEWIQASRVEKYSPNGEALESYNALNIASAVKMGYYDHLPYLTAQNATYQSVLFESFELDYGGQLESEIAYSAPEKIDDALAHAGARSLRVDAGETMTTPVMAASGQTDMLVQVWVKGAINEQVSTTMLSANGLTTIDSEPMTEIARSGDWGLYQSVLNPQGNNTFKVNLRYDGSAIVWMDDMRVQPMDAEMACYVYDPATLRLLATFDGQHFGLYYQYDGEGKLVRKTIETERGIRTLQETFYNLPKVNKDN